MLNKPLELLEDNEPSPYYLINAAGEAPVFITCDHASKRIPNKLKDFAKQDDIDKHIGFDIGALDISKELSALFDAPMLYSSYSRLVIDLNRQLADPTSIPEVSDGIEIPGNKDLSVEEKRLRADTFFWPYHNQFAHVLDSYNQQRVIPLVIGVHTCTPHFKGESRPWHIGIMWDTDDRIAKPFMEYLRGIKGICVGDNEPYHAVDPEGIDPVGYAFEMHARSRGLPHVFIEVRQDLVATEEGAKKWAKIIYEGLADIIKNQELMYMLK